jgi:anti-sigma B factor antagonist
MRVADAEQDAIALRGWSRDMQQLTTDSDLIPAAQKEGDALILGIRGEIDLHNSPELRTELLDLLAQHKPVKLILDLARVPYIDSSALAVFVEALKKLMKSGGKVFLVGLQPRVQGLLEIARLSSIFVICRDTPEALAK